MNWTQFLLGLSALYLVYYFFNILFDLFKPKPGQSTGPGAEEITFYEENLPETVYAEENGKEEIAQTIPVERQAISSGVLQATGGINLKQLFSLAQSDLIEYTKAIPY
ncbi:hypothetical protein [Pedobacter sp. ASV28]|uniref:hypothetical protein n=1 Tax=Pedobacter sp. ASV28 TaxID=2795123 RepID=UPI0018EC8A36|nr:hypothetical protein [Pedobacter sp. ASV28]